MSQLFKVDSESNYITTAIYLHLNMTQIDFLYEWHSKMSELFWKSAFNTKKVLNQDKLFNLPTLRFIYDSLNGFFPKESYTVKTTKGQLKLNWLQYYLSVRDPQFIGYARELSFIINYYNNSHHQLQKLDIKPTDKNISRLRDRFFELFVNMILENNGINSIPDKSYYIDATEKPIDSYFEHEDKKYLIECAKLYDLKQSMLLKTVVKVIKRVFTAKGKMVQMYAHIQPSGYILFKKTNDIALTEHQLEINFSDKFQEYLDNMNSKNEVIQPYSILETDSYKIFIGSNLFYKFAEDDDRFKDYDMYVYFQCNIKFDNIQMASFNINAVHKRNTEQEYKIISSRIENKIKQHKNAADFKLIIFLEFEQGVSVGDEERPLSADFNYLNFKRFDKYVNERVSIFFLLKRYNNMTAYYETRFLYHPSFDAELLNKLIHLKFPIFLS